MIHIKNLDKNKIRIYEKSYKSIFVYYVGYTTVKDPSYATINSANPLYFGINLINGYIEQSNGNKYLTLVPPGESKDTQKRYEELWIKIKDFIRSITNNSNNYYEVI